MIPRFHGRAWEPAAAGITSALRQLWKCAESRRWQIRQGVDLHAAAEYVHPVRIRATAGGRDQDRNRAQPRGYSYENSVVQGVRENARSHPERAGISRKRSSIRPMA